VVWLIDGILTRSKKIGEVPYENTREICSLEHELSEQHHIDMLEGDQRGPLLNRNRR